LIVEGSHERILHRHLSKISNKSPFFDDTQLEYAPLLVDSNFHCKCSAVIQYLHHRKLESSPDSHFQYWQSFSGRISTERTNLTPYLIVFSIFLPWITVQKYNNFRICCPSPNVALLTFPGKGDVGTFARISTDLVEWHSFSVAGTSFDRKTGRSQIQLIIGASGDWTKNLIDKVQTGDIPKHLWVRRFKPPGFMFSINAYSRVVVVATGAGIAPVLPHILENKHKLYILWIGNNHQLTYGKKMWSLISNHSRLKIYDTGELGRPNVGDLAIQIAREFRAQAVFCVSNRSVTKTVVSACLVKGIPAYGASWDS